MTKVWMPPTNFGGCSYPPGTNLNRPSVRKTRASLRLKPLGLEKCRRIGRIARDLVRVEYCADSRLHGDFEIAFCV